MRLFMAVELSDAMKSSLKNVQRSLSQFDSVVRWMTEEHMHLTLKFFGEVPDGQVNDIGSATQRVAEASAPFRISLHDCGCFPPKGAVRVLWAGLNTSGDELADFQRACELCYAELDFEPEGRPFTPHLTLGRVRERQRTDGLREAAAAARPSAASQRVETVCVFQSTQTPRGVRHDIISRHPLGGSEREDA